jgi:hypothetical protein
MEAGAKDQTPVGAQSTRKLKLLVVVLLVALVVVSSFAAYSFYYFEARNASVEPKLIHLLDTQQMSVLIGGSWTQPSPKQSAFNASNPTGTVDNVAGISNKEGNVVGLMPHPERATDPLLSPSGDCDGALIFRSMLEGI